MATRLAALLALSAAAIGCGDLGGDTKPETPAPVVSKSELAGFQQNGPAYAFMQWFRALQLHDAKRMAAFYLPSLGLSAEDLARQRRAAAYAVDPLAPPLVQRVTERGSRALVRVRFRTGKIAPNGRVDYTNKNESSFELKRADGRWLLASNSFLALLAREPADSASLPEQVPVPKVSRRQLARYPEGSPSRAFLEWFGALQRNRIAAALRYYAPELKLTERELARVRERAAYAFDSFGPPRMLGQARQDPVATVRVAIRISSGQAGGPRFTERPPTSFELRRDGGQWKLTSNALLEILASRG